MRAIVRGMAMMHGEIEASVRFAVEPLIRQWFDRLTTVYQLSAREAFHCLQNGLDAALKDARDRSSRP